MVVGCNHVTTCYHPRFSCRFSLDKWFRRRYYYNMITYTHNGQQLINGKPFTLRGGVQTVKFAAQGPQGQDVYIKIDGRPELARLVTEYKAEAQADVLASSKDLIDYCRDYDEIERSR